MSDEIQATNVVEIQPGNQITMPDELREELGMSDGSLVRLSVEDGAPRLTPDVATQDGEESEWLAAIENEMARIRAELLEHGLVEDGMTDAAGANARAEPSRGSPGLRGLYEYFAPVREEILARGISEMELNADIDAAIAEVGAEQLASRA